METHHHCLECNACCKGLIVYLAPDDFLHVKPEWIDYTHGRPHMRQRHDHERSCIALNLSTGYCQIYENRPQRCQLFRENGERCQQWAHEPPLHHVQHDRDEMARRARERK